MFSFFRHVTGDEYFISEQRFQARNGHMLRKRQSFLKPLFYKKGLNMGYKRGYSKTLSSQVKVNQIKEARTTISLSKEIMYLINEVKLNENDIAVRRKLIKQINNECERVLIDREIDIYGSYRTGLSCFFSDVDLRLVVKHEEEDGLSSTDISDTSDDEGKPTFSASKHMKKLRQLRNYYGIEISKREAVKSLRLLSNRLRKYLRPNLGQKDVIEKNMTYPFRSMHVRAFCRVPIINIQTHFKFEIDISVKDLTGSPNTHPIVSELCTWLFFKEMCMILKLILHSRRLDLAFEGGLSSFNLYLLLFFFFQTTSVSLRTQIASNGEAGGQERRRDRKRRRKSGDGSGLRHKSYNTLNKEYLSFKNETQKSEFSENLVEHDILEKLLKDFLKYYSREENLSRDCIFEVNGKDFDLGNLQKENQVRKLFKQTYNDLKDKRGILFSLGLKKIEDLRRRF